MLETRADGGPANPDSAGDLKVRIGVGLGVRTDLNGPSFGEVVDSIERLGFDSLWLSERLTGSAPDPVVAMAYGAGRTTRLKFGMSVLVVPGRNPIVLAKEMATLSLMSGGRLLPAFGLGAVNPGEQAAFGVTRGERAAWFDEALAVMRSCWFDDEVNHQGERFRYEGLRLRPQPARLDVWLGGQADSELRRIGRLADGWLPSFILPSDIEPARRIIEESAHRHDRVVDDDHYGVMLAYTETPPDDRMLAGFAARRPDLDDPASIIPVGWDALVQRIREFIEVGVSKFVVLPLREPDRPEDWDAHLSELAGVVLPLETR